MNKNIFTCCCNLFDKQDILLVLPNFIKIVKLKLKEDHQSRETHPLCRDVMSMASSMLGAIQAKELEGPPHPGAKARDVCEGHGHRLQGVTLGVARTVHRYACNTTLISWDTTEKNPRTNPAKL